MASMRDIKRRKASIQSTGQITKAMKLVSTVKLQKSRQKAEGSKPYFDLMYETISSMLKKSGTIDHKYLRAGATDGKAVIAITSNRGLAGGYNNNIVKLIAGNEALTPEKTRVYAIGRKGRDGLAKKGYEIAEDYSEVIDEPAYQDAADLTKELLAAFGRGEIGEIHLRFETFALLRLSCIYFVQEHRSSYSEAHQAPSVYHGRERRERGFESRSPHELRAERRRSAGYDHPEIYEQSDLWCAAGGSCQ